MNRNPLTDARLKATEEFYDSERVRSGWLGEQYKQILAHYYRLLIPPDASVLEVGCARGELLALLPNRNVAGIDISSRQLEYARQRVPHGRFICAAAETCDLEGTFDYIVLSDVIGVAADVQQAFSNLARFASPTTRLLVNYHNHLWRPLISLMERLRLKTRQPSTSWFGRHDVRNILWLGGWTVIHEEARILCPASLLGAGTLCNRLLAPLLPPFCLSVFCAARIVKPRTEPCSVTIVIPARNEAGNIEAAVDRMPGFGDGQEILFVEGHSQDNTWEAIQEVQRRHPERNIRAMRQTGVGKGNAVREALASATGDILMILDADLTMPPEELPKYYDALMSGKGELANGVRLIYPIQERAMRFLNLLANRAFSILFTWILGQPVKDTLCGTKAIYRHDYEALARNRGYFGLFDPFGDFDLLFGAAKLNLQIIDVPIRYADRVYGATNIRRWSHGWLLLRMAIFGAKKFRMV